MPYSETGLNTDPAFRRQRARKAALSRTDLDHYIAKIVESAGALTDEQRVRLAELLPPVADGEVA